MNALKGAQKEEKGGGFVGGLEKNSFNWEEAVGQKKNGEKKRTGVRMYGCTVN